ncbi:MAG: hypothetical protein IKI56_07310 [Ruminococcus sp.]|nr:hypothetical protein [Ruminococcus sp.]
MKQRFIPCIPGKRRPQGAVVKFLNLLEALKSVLLGVEEVEVCGVESREKWTDLWKPFPAGKVFKNAVDC